MKKSVIFWNCVLILIVILFAIISIKLFIAVELILSIIILFAIITGNFDYIDVDGLFQIVKNNFWIVITPITIIAAILILIGMSISWIYKNTISKFNNWLDKK